MKFAKSVAPILIGFIVFASFIYVGTGIITFFYGENRTFSGALDLGKNSKAYNTYEIFLWVFMTATVAKIALYFFGRDLKISFKKLLVISLIPSIFAYVWLAYDITNNERLSVGLYLMAFRGDAERMQRLLFLGANPNYVVEDRNPNLHTVLMIAAGKGNEKIVKLLLLSGANKDALNKDGSSALDIAKTRGFEKVVKILEE